MGGRRWTKRELTFIDEHRSYMTPAMMAKYIGRTRASVCVAMSRNGYGSYLSDSDLLSLNQVYLITGVSKDKLRRRWIPNGLRCRKIGNAHMISQTDLLRYMEKHPEDWNDKEIKDEAIFSGLEWFDKIRQNSTRHRYYWTDDDVTVLKAMYAKGCPFAEISERIGRTPTAINQKLVKMRKRGWRL